MLIPTRVAHGTRRSRRTAIAQELRYGRTGFRLNRTNCAGCQPEAYFDEEVNGVGPSEVSCRNYAWAH